MLSWLPSLFGRPWDPNLGAVLVCHSQVNFVAEHSWDCVHVVVAAWCYH